MADPIRQAVAELDAIHRPYRYDMRCVTCYPEDSRWPCASRLVADDLRALIGGASDDD